MTQLLSSLSSTDAQAVRFGRGAVSTNAFDVAGALTIIRRRGWAFIVAFVILVSISAGLASQLTPRYSATASVLIDVRQTEVIDLEAVLSGLPPDSAVVDTEVEIIRSRAMTRRVVSRLELADNPEFNPALQADQSQSRGWMRAVARVLGRSEAGDGAAAPQRTDALFNRFESRLSVHRVGKTYLIDIAYETETPAAAADAVNALADLYIERQLETKFEATRRANDWLSGRLGALRLEVENSENAVEQYRADAGLMHSGGATLIESRIADLNTQIAEASADLAGQERSEERRVGKECRSRWSPYH